MVLFRSLNLIDGVFEDIQENMAIRMEGERIADIMADRDGLSANRVIDLEGAYVTPASSMPMFISSPPSCPRSPR
ncbi:MAG: hypothetical protein SWK76_07565 [Actinomycetota bacterium]|nr:hypothetical protein [Actinomycetota bacterium]